MMSLWIQQTVLPGSTNFRTIFIIIFFHSQMETRPHIQLLYVETKSNKLLRWLHSMNIIIGVIFSQTQSCSCRSIWRTLISLMNINTCLKMSTSQKTAWVFVWELASSNVWTLSADGYNNVCLLLSTLANHQCPLLYDWTWSYCALSSAREIIKIFTYFPAELHKLKM